MEKFEVTVKYTIEEEDSWRSQKGFKIKSNIADDELIECRLAKSLVDYLKKESVILEPDKLLVKLAECQKRNLESTIEGLDDIELKIQTQTSRVSESIKDACLTYEAEKEKLYDRMDKSINSLSNKLDKANNKIDKESQKLFDLRKTINNLDDSTLDRIITTIEGLSRLIEKDKDLAEIVFSNYKK